ncbi:MAG TPA: hypothetical protein VGC13_04695 [Longimicrobium sp.]|jgi:hypothetical protein|uniref:hypothetical protein n=1 Tax=Longimicrobium sp. TaxID=2029185 RepID=UPI002ED8B876
MTKLNLDELSVETFEALDARLSTEGKHELFASDLRSCWDTECGRNTYCASSPCAC